MHTALAFGSYFAAVATIVAGLVVVGLGQVFGALREIALNTRAMAFGATPQNAASTSQYTGLNFIALALTFVGGIVVVLGFVVLGSIGLASTTSTSSAESAPVTTPTGLVPITSRTP